MKPTSFLLAAAGLALLTACNDATSPTDPSLSAHRMAAGGTRRVSVMTRNVYIGFDGDAAIAALATGDPAVFGPVLAQAVTTLQNTDFGTRARAFVAEIERARPDMVGLQEVYQIHADLSAFGLPVTIDLDYLQILQAALAQRHLPYAVVATIVDTDMQPFPGIELVDRDVLLVNTEHVTVGTGVIAKTFEYNIGPIAPGIDKKAGYIAAPLTVDGIGLTFVTTHLESDLGPGSYPLVTQLRAAQATEIATVIAAAPRAVVVGDLNDTAGSMMYQVLAGAGFTDTWTALRPHEAGLTDNCFSTDLSDRWPHCQQRIDFVFERGLEQPRAGLLGIDYRVGIEPWERMHGPAGLIWPSDHAGVVGDFVVPVAHGLHT